MTVESLIQEKNSTLAVAPTDLDEYPESYIVIPLFPLALTWVVSSSQDPSGVLRRNVVEVEVFCAEVGKPLWPLAKAEIRDTRDLFMAEYTITNNNCVLQNENPTVRIVPGSVAFSGVKDVVITPDGCVYHGFSFTLEVTETL